LLCAILTAIGGVFFFSLRSIEKLNGAERSVALGEIAVLHRIGKNVGLRQVEVFRHLAATSPDEKERHEQVIAHVVETNTKSLGDYGGAIDNEAEKRLFAELLEAREAYADRTEQLLALSRARRNAEAATFVVATQIPTYDRYQSSVDALLRFEEAEGRGIAAATSGQIEQTRIVGDILIGLAIAIALGTGAAVYGTVGRLRRDKKKLRTEVAEHERAEQALRDSEARYRLLVDQSPDAILVVCDDKIVFVNPAGLRLLGADRSDQLIGRSVSKLVHPDEQAEVARRGREVAEGKQPPATERRLIRLDGSTVEVESKVISFLYEGRPALQVIARDNTERARAERKVRESEANLALAQQVAGVGSWEYQFTADGQVDEGKLLCSQEAYRIFGRSSDEFHLSIQTFYQAVHPDDRAFVAGCFQALREKNEPFDCDYRIIRPDGAERIIDSVAATVYDPDTGKRSKVVGTVFDITERRATEKQLREADEKYRSIFDNALEGIFQNTPDGIIISANPALARMFGFASPEELIREHNSLEPQSYTAPAERQEFKRLIEKRGVVNNFEFEVKRKDGSAIWVSENARIVRDAAGNALYYEGSVRDITERKRSELILRESEEHLKLVMAASNDGIFEHDFVTDVLTWSDRMYDMFGLDRRSFIPTLAAFTALLHPDDRAAFQKAVAEQMVSGGRYDAHTRIRRYDGSYGNFLGRGEVVLDAAGKPVRIVGSVADLTSILQTEQKLVEQGNLLNLAQDAIMVRDMDDRIVFWNHGAEVLYGWSAEEVRGHPNDDFLEYENPVRILAERILLETGAWSGDCRHLTKQGDTVVVRSRWTLVRDEHGQPKSKLIIATDMTEQKKIEEQFLRAQRLESIGTLASGVAHDLNNILLPIMMAAPILRDEMDPVERDKFLDIVETSAQRGADIIKQVLTFARGTDGDRILLQPIYLLEEVSKIAGQTFPKSIALRTCYEEDIRSLEADPTQLHQVLLNLCINARDAMPNGGELCLGAENFDVDAHYASMIPGAAVGPHVLLQITDTGSGIPRDVIDKIFDPFFTTKGIGKGTGLGLSTVAGIVRSHGGFIHVESQPGHTSFKVFLPAKATLDASIALQANATVPRGNGQTILLVDDEPSIREVAAIILESHGYKVLVAEDGPSALAIFAREMGHIVAVVTDLAMPGMDGLMLVRTLRRLEPGLKVIVSTGRDDDSHAGEIPALNVDGWLTKPYTTRNLLLKLSHVLHSGMQDAA
jgi:PAS domain S-box-containing protein